VIWGTPFLGHYETDDVFGLFEIASNAREDNTYGSREDSVRLENLLARYHVSTDKRKFVANCDDDLVAASWFANRYNEFSEFITVSRGIALADQDVLDVGAGSGYDTLRLARSGARTTAVEYNPVLIRRGRSVVPEARWIGALAHVLPFENDSFDIVCCNAALHHMRDVRGAMHEMLRVLRPGGWLLTCGDPFRGDDTDEDYELDVFDEHPGALLGINEGIPTLNDLVATLVACERYVDVELHVRSASARRFVQRLLERLRPAGARRLSERSTIGRAGGSLAMRVHVKRHMDLRPATQGDAALRAGDYADVLESYEAAVASLVPLLPSAQIDRPFPGDRQTKLELLNGWQKPRSGKQYRTGYKRARWFLTRPHGAERLTFAVKALRASGAALLHLYVDASRITTVDLQGGCWAGVTVPVRHVANGNRFVFELELELTQDSVEGTFDDFRFAVKDRAFT
jgi:SAM-dependent methyltransferase